MKRKKQSIYEKKLLFLFLKKKILSFSEENGFSIKSIFLTHSHWDHIGAVLKLKEETNGLVYVHKEDAKNLENPGSDGVFSFKKVEGCKPDFLLEDKEKLNVGKIEIEVIHTPGHTPGSVCFYIPKEKILFSGDTVFKGGMGNISFPASNKSLMLESLRKIAKLPKDTKIMPGHGEDTFIEDEKWLKNPEEYFF